MSKSIDKKLEEIGFYLIYDGDTHVHYERHDERINLTHTVMLVHKKSGKHIMQSYDENLFASKGIGNVCVGLTYHEMKLFMKKMKQKGWKSK